MTLQPAKWAHLASTNRLERSSQAVSVVGQMVYIFGGELLPRQPVSNELDVISLTQRREPNTQTIASQHDGPTPRVGSPATTLNDNTIWIYSGRGGLEMKPIEEKGALWSYNTTTSQWSLVSPADKTDPFPVGRSYHCITSDKKDRIYLHSGCPEVGRLDDLWAFDVKQKQWTKLPSAPGPPRGGSSIAYCEGKLYRLNGFDGSTEIGGSVDIFFETTNSWSTTPYKADGIEGPVPRSVSALLSIAIYGKAYLVTLFGERQPSSLGHAGAGNMLSDAWAWDIQTSSWEALRFTGDGPDPRGWFGADVGQDSDGKNTIILHGGLSSQNTRLGDIWELAFE